MLWRTTKRHKITQRYLNLPVQPTQLNAVQRALIPVRPAGTKCTYPEGLKAELTE